MSSVLNIRLVCPARKDHRNGQKQSNTAANLCRCVWPLLAPVAGGLPSPPRPPRSAVCTFSEDTDTRILLPRKPWTQIPYPLIHLNFPLLYRKQLARQIQLAGASFYIGDVFGLSIELKCVQLPFPFPRNYAERIGPDRANWVTVCWLTNYGHISGAALCHEEGRGRVEEGVGRVGLDGVEDGITRFTSTPEADPTS